MDWNTVLLILYVVYIISTIMLVLLENRNPLKALSWVIILVLLPVAGLVIYLIFGKDTRRYRFISKRSYERIMQNATPELPIRSVSALPHVGLYELVAQLVRHQTGNQVLEAEAVTLFREGADKMEALLADIAQAQHYIHVQYYILKDDATGNRLASALIAKAREGVEVRVLYDHVGSFSTKRSFFKQLQRAGVEVYPILEVAFPVLTSKVNYRNHRKVVVIDGTIGYVGGMNVADHYVVGSKLGLWRDAHLRIMGVAVNGLQAAFVTDWYVASRRILPARYFMAHQQLPPPSAPHSSNVAVPSHPTVHKVLMQTFTSGPTGYFRTIIHVLARLIYQAKEAVRIQTPYFMPPESLYKAIISAALSGVRVELTIPQKSDTMGVTPAAASYFEFLLEAGVHIYLYQGGFLHAKVITIDDQVAVVGSANMDFRSMEHNFEITSLLYNQPFTTRLNQELADDIANHCTKIDAEEWAKRPLKWRLRESVMRLFAPLM